MNDFQPTMDRPIAHWHLPTDENFLVVPRAGHLDDERLVGIAATATSIRPPDGTIPTDAISLHLTLVMEPVDGVGATIETAWPCTVAPAA